MHLTAVDMIDKAERILPFEDEDIARVIAERMEAKGITLHRGSLLFSLSCCWSVNDSCVQQSRSPTHLPPTLFFAGAQLVSMKRVGDEVEYVIDTPAPAKVSRPPPCSK
jgi:hypothetical protein